MIKRHALGLKQHLDSLKAHALGACYGNGRRDERNLGRACMSARVHDELLVFVQRRLRQEFFCRVRGLRVYECARISSRQTFTGSKHMRIACGIRYRARVFLNKTPTILSTLGVVIPPAAEAIFEIDQFTPKKFRRAKNKNGNGPRRRLRVSPLITLGVCRAQDWAFENVVHVLFRRMGLCATRLHKCRR